MHHHLIIIQHTLFIMLSRYLTKVF